MTTPEPSTLPATPVVQNAPRRWGWLAWTATAIVLIAALAALWNVLTKTAAPDISTPATSTTPAPLASGSAYFIGSPSAPIQLTYAVHWAEPFQVQGITEQGTLKYKGLKQYLEEYARLHTDVAFKILIIPYQDYEQKVALLADAETAPDIYQIYAPWGVSYARNGLLDSPPSDIQDDIRKNFVSSAGATIDGRLWGYPTEINTFALAYNKKLFAAAGIAAPPKTWAELAADAKLLTKRDASGNITQYGIAFLRQNDWQVVDPFLSLLFSNNGAYLSDDLKTPRFQEAAGAEALDSILGLFRAGSTDGDGNFFDFKDGKVAMVITPPWPKAIFQAGFGASFPTSVGVTALPYLKKTATLQYSWFMGVTAQSAYRTEAWKFLQWFAGEEQTSTGTTRYGDLLAQTIGAIPSRNSDIKGHAAILNDNFTKAFVDALGSSVPEPNVADAGAIKKILMKHIESAWDGAVTAGKALLDAAKEIQPILDRNAESRQ